MPATPHRLMEAPSLAARAARELLAPDIARKVAKHAAHDAFHSVVATSGIESAAADESSLDDAPAIARRLHESGLLSMEEFINVTRIQISLREKLLLERGTAAISASKGAPLPPSSGSSSKKDSLEFPYGGPVKRPAAQSDSRPAASAAASSTKSAASLTSHRPVTSPHASFAVLTAAEVLAASVQGARAEAAERTQLAQTIAERRVAAAEEAQRAAASAKEQYQAELAAVREAEEARRVALRELHAVRLQTTSARRTALSAAKAADAAAGRSQKVANKVAAVAAAAERLERNRALKAAALAVDPHAVAAAARLERDAAARKANRAAQRASANERLAAFRASEVETKRACVREVKAGGTEKQARADEAELRAKAQRAARGTSTPAAFWQSLHEQRRAESRD